jgi:glycosyltransferase involved in cell wall biosynthesis
MPVLTIITRTFNGRPAGLAKNVASVESQSDRASVQHLVVVDSDRRGVEWAQWNLRNVSDKIAGDYVMLLDDDDYLIDDHFVRDFVSISHDYPEVVIVRMDMGTGLVLPVDSMWEQAPRHSHIACSCYIVMRDIWIEHVENFGDRYDGDFQFIDSVWKHGHEFYWWRRTVSRVGRVSRGAPERGGVAANGV